MVDAKIVNAQLKRIKFDTRAWGRAEVKELPSILAPEEKIYECVNGAYDGGFALLVATDMRVLLVDKKPLNYLTVEDLRFDMINQIDYNHRLMGATIVINTGFKTLKFTSWDKRRLRKLINHVQDRMSEIKKEESEQQENQKQHLAQINQQLQAYLLAQHQQIMQAQASQQQVQAGHPQPVRPSPELSDYLFAQSLLRESGYQAPPSEPPASEPAAPAVTGAEPPKAKARPVDSDDLFAEGYREVFGKAGHLPAEPAATQPAAPAPAPAVQSGSSWTDLAQLAAKSLEINPLKIAYAKLPMMLRNRKFGRPNPYEHSQAPAMPATTQTAPQA